MWISVKDKLPKHGQTVFVLVDGNYGVAEYSESFGFSADSSAYDIYCHDDSGMEISFDGDISHWMEIVK